jgi:hypothetical protein
MTFMARSIRMIRIRAAIPGLVRQWRRATSRTGTDSNRWLGYASFKHPHMHIARANNLRRVGGWALYGTATGWIREAGADPRGWRSA